MKRSPLFFLILAICSATLSTIGLSQVPRNINYQGVLTDQNGVAITNGVRLVQFKIYSVPSGGSPAWAGEIHRTTVNGWENEQREQGPGREAADDGPAERRGLSSAFAESERHRKHAGHHREARHEDGTKAARGALD